MIPFRSITSTVPWTPLFGTIATSMVMIYLQGVEGITLAGEREYRVQISHAEVIATLAALIVVILLTPPLPDVDLRRPRAKLLAVSRLALAYVCVLVISTFASWSIRHTFIIKTALAVSEIPELPASELIISNCVFLASICAVMNALRGRGAAILCTFGVWALTFAPVFFIVDFQTWPLDYFQGPGPWFSLPHVFATAALVCVTFAVQWQTAGAGAKSTLSRHMRA